MTSPLPSFNSLTASARIVLPKRSITPRYETWQDQVWDYYDRLGEFEAGVGWLANAMSRVRLLAAELSTSGDKPVMLDSGPAAEAVSRLAGGVGGQAQLMKEFTIHLSVPGEGWLVGERMNSETEILDAQGNLTIDEMWSIKSADELRVSSRRQGGQSAFEVREDETRTSWRLLAPDSLVIRCWEPHPRFGWRAESAARHAMIALQKLDLINKRIIVTILSRLASNGLLVYDKGRLSIQRQTPASTDPGSVETDPFAEMLVAVAGRGISDPTSAEAVLPIPIGIDLAGDLANVRADTLLRHVTFSNELDQMLIELHDSAVRELATGLDMPAEVLLGLGDVNHWSAWQIEESGIKIHVAPKAELICHSLTTGYLIPTLRAASKPLVGPNGGRIIIWYDPSEITTRPDKSAVAAEAYDKGEISGTAYRREVGLHEDDKPTISQKRETILWKIATEQSQIAWAALEELTGPTTVKPETTGDDKVEDVEEDKPADGLPSTRDEAPPPPSDDVPSTSGSSPWVFAETPVAARVTPQRRNGGQVGVTDEERAST